MNMKFRRVITYFYSFFKKNTLPTEMTVGDRTYEILSFLREGDDPVLSYITVERAKEMNAHLGQNDGQYLLDNQQDIPVAIRGMVTFVFTDWRHHAHSGFVGCIFWDGDGWVQDWDWLARDWYGRARLLRRK